VAIRPFSADLQKQFRDTLQTPGSPEVVDDGQPVIPVAVVAQVNTATSSGFTRITDGTDTALVTTAGSLHVATDVLPGGGTFFRYYGAGTGANVTAHTVTAGKTAYVIWFSGGGSVNGYSALLTSADATIINGRFLANTSFLYSEQVLASYAAGTNVRVIGSAATGEWALGLIEV